MTHPVPSFDTAPALGSTPGAAANPPGRAISRDDGPRGKTDHFRKIVEQPDNRTAAHADHDAVRRVLPAASEALHRPDKNAHRAVLPDDILLQVRDPQVAGAAWAQAENTSIQFPPPTALSRFSGIPVSVETAAAAGDGEAPLLGLAVIPEASAEDGIASASPNGRSPWDGAAPLPTVQFARATATSQHAVISESLRIDAPGRSLDISHAPEAAVSFGHLGNAVTGVPKPGQMTFFAGTVSEADIPATHFGEATHAAHPGTVNPSTETRPLIANRPDLPVMTPHVDGPSARQQLLEALSVRPMERSLEVRLDPPDLGRVRIDFEFARDGAIKAVIATTEPDTGQLLRRQAALLHRDLTDAGFEGVSIEFAEDSSMAQEDWSVQTPNTEHEPELVPSAAQTLANGRGLMLIDNGRLDRFF